MSNMTRSNADESSAKLSDKSKWCDLLTPPDSIIHKVELMYYKDDSALCGVKFIDNNNETLLACGEINNSSWRKYDWISIKVVILKEGERLLGVKSGGRDCYYAEHYDL